MVLTMADTKWIKHVAAKVGSAYPSGWNLTLYSRLKRSFFSTNQEFSSPKFLESIRPKRDYKTVNESSKKSVGSETSRENLVMRRIRTITKNQTPYPSSSHSNTITDCLYHTDPRHTVPRYQTSHARTTYPIYQPLRSDRIWHKVNF